eukprot:TRINITY_DN13246_c1_g2_i1.p1 TRINITY_DN13246_c1_g2~~TRINITY_DN13246_c1_g2_i1.p1  ORF type:complete len:825 (+),score=113.95 TRINITY_DN13246_c1_g2_i1:92-2476(+)
MMCEIRSGLSDAIICSLSVSADLPLENLKKQVEPASKVPTSLQKLVLDGAHGAALLDDSLFSKCCQDVSSAPLSIRLVKMPLQAACSTPEKLIEVLAALKLLGPEASTAYLEEIVSLVARPPEETPPVLGGWLRGRHRLSHSQAWRVNVAACQTLEPLGSLCSQHALEVVRALPAVLDEKSAEDMVEDIRYCCQRNNTHGLRLSSAKWAQNFVGHGGRDGCEEYLPVSLSSLFSAMGPEALQTIMENCSETLHEFRHYQKCLLLLSIARSSMCFDELAPRFAAWFANFLDSDEVDLSWCALEYLSALASQSNECRSAAEVYVPKVMPLLARRDGEDGHHHRDKLDSMRLAACKLLVRCQDVLKAHAADVIGAFFGQVDENTAQQDINRFVHKVCAKSHGAYADFTKRTSREVNQFTQLFSCLGYEGFTAISLLPEMFGNAGIGQKALLLLCAAMPFPRFDKSEALISAAWISQFLKDPHWQLRLAATHCLQRLMAGYMGPEPHAHKLAPLLRDKKDFVRQSAAIALGCLGRNAVRHVFSLLSLLKDDCFQVRYASLLTLGGLRALAKPYTDEIAKQIESKDAKCRMAALRALKLMGYTAKPFINRLEKWQQIWYSNGCGECCEEVKKLEPITTRALLFPEAQLKHIFKGPAPLGKGFGGNLSTKHWRIEKLSAVMTEHEQRRRKQVFGRSVCDLCDALPETHWLEIVSEHRESREHYRSNQLRHHTAQNAQRLRAKQLSASPKHSRKSWGSRYARKASRFYGTKARSHEKCQSMPEWVVPTSLKREGALHTLRS